MNRPNSGKGFTLIELLIVIAIIAVLAVAVILSLNPAELLRQARDSTRISDLSTLKSAISLFIADQASTSIGTFGTCYADLNTLTSTTITTKVCNIIFTNITAAATSATPTAVGGATAAADGWIPVNFTKVSSGSPLGALPHDPLDSGVIKLLLRGQHHPARFQACRLHGKQQIFQRRFERRGI